MTALLSMAAARFLPSLVILCKKYSCFHAMSKIHYYFFNIMAPSCLLPPCLHESPMMLCCSFNLCIIRNTKGTRKTHYKVRKIALLALGVSALSKKVLNLTSSINYFWIYFILHRHLNMINSWQTSESL